MSMLSRISSVAEAVVDAASAEIAVAGATARAAGRVLAIRTAAIALGLIGACCVVAALIVLLSELVGVVLGLLIAALCLVGSAGAMLLMSRRNAATSGVPSLADAHARLRAAKAQLAGAIEGRDPAHPTADADDAQPAQAKSGDALHAWAAMLTDPKFIASAGFALCAAIGPGRAIRALGGLATLASIAKTAASRTEPSRRE
ncbi:MAG: hypothetical protein RBS39_04130 [Phycisphaerales bacterium]|jgi:hypothetical protein|nr:hypothetical protein [Phycisphaerales bacterium]